MNFFKRFISKIKKYFLKRKLNKIFGYKYGKVIRNYDSSSFYPYVMPSEIYYADTDSVRKENKR